VVCYTSSSSSYLLLHSPSHFNVPSAPILPKRHPSHGSMLPRCFVAADAACAFRSSLIGCVLYHDVSIWTRTVCSRPQQNPSVYPLLVRHCTHGRTTGYLPQGATKVVALIFFFLYFSDWHLWLMLTFYCCRQQARTYLLIFFVEKWGSPLPWGQIIKSFLPWHILLLIEQFFRFHGVPTLWWNKKQLANSLSLPSSTVLMPIQIAWLRICQFSSISPFRF
jgi:hypothetical protein